MTVHDCALTVMSFQLLFHNSPSDIAKQGTSYVTALYGATETICVEHRRGIRPGLGDELCKRWAKGVPKCSAAVVRNLKDLRANARSDNIAAHNMLHGAKRA